MNRLHAVWMFTLLVFGSGTAVAGSAYLEADQACMKALGDHLVIAHALITGKSVEELKAAATHPEPDRPRVMALIDEAHASNDPKAWFQAYWNACVKNEKRVNFRQAHAIYTVAWGQTHHLHKGNRALLDQMPAPLMVPRAQLCRLYPGANPDCAIQGLYFGGMVLLSDELDLSDAVAAAVMLHEFIHHIQAQVAGHPARDCEEGIAREEEAYRIQAHVLAQARRDIEARQVAIAARALRCKG